MKIKYLKFYLLSILYLTFQISFCQTDENKTGNLNSNLSNENTISFISDMQAPIWLEKVRLKPYKNEEATDTLLKDIIKQKPKALFVLGDAVAFGTSNSEWKKIDSNLINIRKSKIDIFAIPGNHEYMVSIFGKEGINKFSKRFPESDVNGFYKIVDSVAVVLFNSAVSNKKITKLGYLTKCKKTLDSLDSDKSVKFIILATHYSPFTNSDIVSPNKFLRDSLLPIYINSKKAKLFLSGHSHNLEYFDQKSKKFLVIGGGGGLKQPLKSEKDRTWKDLISEEDKPLYFYLNIVRKGDKLKVFTRGMKKDFKFFDMSITVIE